MFVKIGDGNESDHAIFAQLMKQFKKEWNLDSIYVADSALYSAENIQHTQMGVSVFSSGSSCSFKSPTSDF